MSDELLDIPTFFEYIPLLENDTKYSRLCSIHFTYSCCLCCSSIPKKR